jgi:hypothetical protein
MTPEQAIALANARLRLQNGNLQVPVGEGEQIMSPEKEQPRSIGDYITPLVEIPATILSHGALALPSAYANPKDQTALSSKYGYKPQSPVSQDILSTLGEATKYLPPYLGGNIVGSAMRSASLLKQPVENVIGNNAQQLAQILRKEPTVTLSGVGAAEVPQAIQRIENAKNLRVPGTMTKGQATRDLGQQAFEIETPKNYPELGKPLTAEKIKQNDTILQNFDAFIDATGKETYGLTATGRVVDNALVNASNKAKSEITNAYEAAKKAGETKELVDVAPIQNYLNGLEAEALNAPIISTAQLKLDKLAKDGKLSINALEELRKMVVRNSQTTPTNMTYAKDIKGVIDTTLENSGGDLYKEARALRSKYGKEFENLGYVDKLLQNKTGTTDRAVALEDVFSHSILSGSQQDVRNIAFTLKKAGPEGQQAWKELQGQTLQYIKDEVTKNMNVNSAGESVVSPAVFKRIVTTLDQDGKLNYIFGKKGSQEIRDLLDYTINVNSSVRGAENTSGTSSALIRTLDTISKSPLGAIPFVKSISKNLAENAQEKIIKKQVEEAINFDPQKLAEQLRKE